MAQVAFSHQFSHRWSKAPQAVKEALIQEFEDIVQLLEPETELDSFQFSVADLHAHIEAINEEVAAEQQAARLEAEKLEAERLEAERLELEAEQAERLVLEAEQAERLVLEQQAAEQQRVFEAEEAAHLAQLDEQPQAEQSAENPENIADNTESAEVIGVEGDSPTTDEAKSADEPPQTHADDSRSLATDASVTEKQTFEAADNTEAKPVSDSEPTATDSATAFAFDNSNVDAELDADFVKELESRIDDYLSEQLANMSEDLKSWLRDQVAERLNHK